MSININSGEETCDDCGDELDVCDCPPLLIEEPEIPQPPSDAALTDVDAAEKLYPATFDCGDGVIVDSANYKQTRSAFLAGSAWQREQAVKEIAEHVYRRRISGENCKASEAANEKYRAQLKAQAEEIAELRKKAEFNEIAKLTLDLAEAQLRAHADEVALAKETCRNIATTLADADRTIEALKRQVESHKLSNIAMYNQVQAATARIRRLLLALTKIVGPMEILPPFGEKPTVKWMMEQRREYDLAVARAALAADDLGKDGP